MELSPTELQHRLKGLNRRERREQARKSWDLLELWRDPEFAHLSRQAARDASWKMYWSMWRSDYEASKKSKSSRVARAAKWLGKEMKALWRHL
jgi:hypothetical protein